MTNLFDGRITDLLNNSMKYNPETISIGYAILQEKQRIMALVARTPLMAAVNDTDEKALDFLAVELRTPAYKDAFTVDVKRKLIAGTLPFYAKLGTPAAVEWLIQSIYDDGWIEEWYQYGGNPHHFRLNAVVDNTVVSLEDFEELIRSVSFVKRLSSWLDEIVITIRLPSSTLHAGGNFGAVSEIQIPPDTTIPPATTILRTGGVCTILSNLSKGG